MKYALYSGMVVAATLTLASVPVSHAALPGAFGTPLSDTELAQLRGGFVGLDNLQIAIGLEQLVAVDGETLVLNRLTIPNLNQVVDGGRIAARVEQVLADSRPQGTVVIVTPPVDTGSGHNAPVNGGNSPSGAASPPNSTTPVNVSEPVADSQPVSSPGTLISSQMNAGNWMTVIQNRFDGSVIQNIQKLNIELNNLGAAYRLPQGIRNSLPILP